MAHLRKRHKPECAHRASGGKRRCNCDGSWQARIPDPVRGGTHKIERTFRTKQEADAWTVSQRAGQQQGTWVDPRQAERPFVDVVQAWKESWTNRLSPTTAARYRSILDVYLLPTFGQTPIGRITHEVVQRYVNRLTADGMTPGTVRNVFSVLRNAMNRGVRLGVVKVNPCMKIDLPRSPRDEMLFLTADEVRAVAEAIDPYYRVLVYTAAYTGLRAGELLGLRRADVDLLRGVVHVRRALKDVDGRLEFGETKTHTQRQVSLPNFLRDMLREHLAQPLAGDGADALVFPSKTGQPLRHNLFYRRHFKRTVMGDPAKGIPGALPAAKHGLRFHDLRHTCASLSIAAGAHVKLISARLGHSSVQITLDRYSHLYPSVEEALAEQLDALYRAAPAPRNVSEFRAARR
jgi:integrase